MPQVGVQQWVVGEQIQFSSVSGWRAQSITTRLVNFTVEKLQQHYYLWGQVEIIPQILDTFIGKVPVIVAPGKLLSHVASGLKGLHETESLAKNHYEPSRCENTRRAFITCKLGTSISGCLAK